MAVYKKRCAIEGKSFRVSVSDSAYKFVCCCPHMLFLLRFFSFFVSREHIMGSFVILDCYCRCIVFLLRLISKLDILS